LIARFDEVLYRAERAVVAAMLAVMGLVVFLDVIHRMSTREGSLWASHLFVAALASVVASLALLTRGVPNGVPKGIAAGIGVAVARLIFVAVLPNGLVWSQTLALAFTLWLGTIGASLAAHDRRHLALDVGHKLWPPALAPKIAALGHLVTAAFCVVLLWLGSRSVMAHWDLWSATGHAAGNLSGLAIPKWFPALSIPYGMAALTFRFGLEAWRTWTGEVEAGSGDDTLHQLGIDAPKDAT
jgi:TRAP-type C4-dicarboxylate transport system permease small subunit